MAGQPKRILLVDEDEHLRTALAEQLELHEDFLTVEAGSGSEALAALEKDVYEAILLDVALPDMDGRDVCRLLRRKGIHAPVIMLTGLDGEADAILGLDSGANDYVTKPFRLGVLLARLRAHMRQHELSEDAAFAVGTLYLQARGQAVAPHRQGRRRLAQRQGERDLEIPLPRRRCGGELRYSVQRDLGLQRHLDDPHAADPHLPPAPKDRGNPVSAADPDLSVSPERI